MGSGLRLAWESLADPRRGVKATHHGARIRSHSALSAEDSPAHKVVVRRVPIPALYSGRDSPGAHSRRSYT